MKLLLLRKNLIYFLFYSFFVLFQSCSQVDEELYVSTKAVINSTEPPQNQPPIINSITAPANQIYLSGEFLDFTLQFSENVTISNTPTLQINIGGVTRSALYYSGDGTSSIIFRYTTNDPDFDIDGVNLVSYVGASQDIVSAQTQLPAQMTLPNVDTSLVWVKTMPASGLLAHWGFNEAPNSVLATNSVSSDSLVLNNFQNSFWQSVGRVNGSLGFVQASSTWARTTSFTLVGRNDYSISIWYRPQSATSNQIQTIFWQGRSVDNGFGGSTAARELGLSLNQPWNSTCPTHTNFYLGYTDPYSNTTTCLDQTNNIFITENVTNITNNSWIHAVVTISQATTATATASMYIDGILIGSQTSIETNQTGMINQIYFGRTGVAGTRLFNGDLDEIRIYDRALTPSEINRLYQE